MTFIQGNSTTIDITTEVSIVTENVVFADSGYYEIDIYIRSDLTTVTASIMVETSAGVFDFLVYHSGTATLQERSLSYKGSLDGFRLDLVNAAAAEITYKVSRTYTPKYD